MKKILILAVLAVLALTANAYDFQVDGIYYNINGDEATVTYYGPKYNSYVEYYGNITIPAAVTHNGTIYSVTSISNDAFRESRLTSIDIPTSVTSINDGAFQDCIYLTRVNIGNSVTSIGYGAFWGCIGLTSIDIPNSVTTIGNRAFASCTSLEYIEIPNSVTTLGSNAFAACSSLTSVTIGNSLTAISGWAFRSCPNLTSIIIPNSVTEIGGGAFSDCTSLANIEIPNSVISIGGDAFNNTPWFNNHPDGLVYAGKVVYRFKGIMPTGALIRIEEGTLGIAGSAFENCDGLTNIIIPNSVITINYCAFANCTNLKCIEIPNSVTEIESLAFWGCSGLTSIEIPYSVAEIRENVFYECTSLKSIIIPNSVIAIGNGAFSGCSQLTNIEIPNSVITIGEAAFSDCTQLMSIEVPNSVTSIGKFAFAQCTYLESIEIPNTITTIGEAAFNFCENLTTLIITGEGDWKGADLSSATFYYPYIFIDSRITGLKGLRANYYSIYSYATNPPICDENTFTDYTFTLHVPASSLAAYFTAPYWSNFANIIGDAVEPKAVNISQDNVEVNLGSRFNLTTSVIPSNANPNNITWKSTNSTIATVNNGTVTAVGVGECDIIAQCLNKKAICHVVVNDTTITITLDQQEAMVLPNHIITLTPSASPVMPDLAVFSSEPTVAAARLMNGKVQVVGIKEGTTTITVGSADGTAVPATCLVTVYTAPGDTNMDGFINISDVTDMIDYLLGAEMTNFKDGNADLDGDGKITISDVTELIDILLTTNNN